VLHIYIPDYFPPERGYPFTVCPQIGTGNFRQSGRNHTPLKLSNFFAFVFSRVKRMFYKIKSHEAPQTGTSQYNSQEGQVRAFFWGACIFVSRFSCFGTFHTRNSEAGLAHSGENVVIATWKTIDWVREHGTVCMYELMVSARTKAHGARSARWELT
jgi:hypothetical protein